MTRNGDETILTDKYGRCFRKTEKSPPSGANVRGDGLDSWIPRIFVFFCFEKKEENHNQKDRPSGLNEVYKLAYSIYHRMRGR